MAKQTKTTTTKKATAKLSAGQQKPVAKKSPTKLATTTAKAKPKTATTARKMTALKKPAMRRPDQNLPPDADTINAVTNDVQYLTEFLNNYAAHLRALDRMRHNGVGIHRQGFIERALILAQENPEYLPHWLSVQKFEDDNDLFVALRALTAALRQLQELSWNITVEGADMAYTDALEFYSQVQDAARRRVDAAEALYEDLHPFFRHSPRETEEPTKKKTKRDFNAIMAGKKDGKVVVENIRPKTTGGKHEVIDETFKDTASFKETDEGSIEE